MTEQKENRESNVAISITSSATNYQYYLEQVILLLRALFTLIHKMKRLYFVPALPLSKYIK